MDSTGLCEKLRQLDEAKVLLLLGSGAGAPGHLHSRATWQEIDFWMRHCGLPVVRAIRAATHDAATAMGVGHQSGAISPGKIADVIAVRGDVLRNPGAAAVGRCCHQARPSRTLSPWSSSSSGC